MDFIVTPTWHYTIVYFHLTFTDNINSYVKGLIFRTVLRVDGNTSEVSIDLTIIYHSSVLDIKHQAYGQNCFPAKIRAH